MQEENNPYVLFPANLLSAMEKKGWNQAQLAQASSILQGNISHYLTGRRAPKAAQLHMLSTALGVSMESLLTGETSQNASQTTPALNSKALRKDLADARASLDRIEKQLDP